MEKKIHAIFLMMYLFLHLDITVEQEHRVNFVDGWGTVITPADTFSAMRVQSIITAHDSVHIDTIINYGTSFNYTTTEYKWYAYKMGEPVIKVSVRTGTGPSITTVEYQNRPKNITGIKYDDCAMFYSRSLS